MKTKTIIYGSLGKEITLSIGDAMREIRMT